MIFKNKTPPRIGIVSVKKDQKKGHGGVRDDQSHKVSDDSAAGM